MIKEKRFFVIVSNIFNKTLFFCNICKITAIYDQILKTKNALDFAQVLRNNFIQYLQDQKQNDK